MDLVPFDPEIERTLSRIRREKKSSTMSGQNEGMGETRPPTEEIPITEGTRNTPPHMDGARKFGEFINPTHEGYGSAIVRSPLNVNNFELKASIIQLVQNNT